MLTRDSASWSGGSLAVVGLPAAWRSHMSGASPARVAGSKPNQADDDPPVWKDQLT